MVVGSSDREEKKVAAAREEGGPTRGPRWQRARLEVATAVVVAKEGLTATEKEAAVVTACVGEMGKTVAKPTVAAAANCEEESNSGAVGKQQHNLVPAAREGREMAGMADDGCGCGDEVGKRWREKKRQHWIRQLAAAVVEI
ncbi:hypothetical protein BHE74_00019076 [Ensete ventricosum]|nr:hypothetical protein BHE74_00019076 [Ensete ventricosum]RZR97771.1 hypothetical protein BHM03_00027016 [Ensete ventricosum]